MSERPATVVAVLGTATEVGKTYVAARLLRELRRREVRVAARKPAQSYAVDDTGPRDADVLAQASGERPEDVCPPHRGYAVAMAPPMAASVLGRPRIHLSDLVAELRWPPGVDVGLVEGAGGLASPIADDADGLDLAHAVRADAVVIVADAGLGTINAVRSCMRQLSGLRSMAFLNRFDPSDDLHCRNLAWLRDRDGYEVVAAMEDLVRLIAPARP